MAYGLRYTADFDSLANAPLNFTINIYKNNYVGTADTIMLSSEPAIHEWQDDDPFKAIKGSTLTIGIVNNGDVKLLDFYSDNDDEFYVELLWNATGETLFKGYILQDDCQEILVDYAHIISIVATDNLGLLKDVTLGEAAQFAGAPSTKTGIAISASVVFTNQLFTTDTRVAQLKAGVQITIENGAFAGTYNILNIGLNSITGQYTLTLDAQITFAAPYSADITWIDSVALDGYVSLLTVVKLCLKVSNVVCGLRVMSEIYPVGGATGRWLDDTFVLGETFLIDGSYMSCYDVLEKIMSRFYASCFQSHGFWYIVRYGETFKIKDASPTANRFNGYAYDSDFVYQVNYQEDVVFSAGAPLQRFETGLLTSIVRPYKLVEERFDYNQPEDLLKNSNLDELGDLINEYTSGANTIREYNLKYWFNYDASPGPYPSRFIRVISNTATGIEVERYVVVKGNTFDGARGVQSSDILIGKNDIVTYSFDFRSDVSQPGNVISLFAVRLRDGVTTNYINTNSQWGGTLFSYNVISGDNTNQWHTVTIESTPAPFDGLLNVFLATITQVVTNESQYKNFRFSVTNSVNGLTTVTGHVHTTNQFNNLKNELKQQIYIDNSPRGSIAGTLFLYNNTGLLRNKCNQWTYTGTPITFERLGQLTTGEMLYTGNIAKTKYDGTLLYINDVDRMISNFQVFYMQGTYPSLLNWLVPGSVSIDYRANNCNLTLYEIAFNDINPYDSWQLFEDFLNDRLYEFRYLYEK